MHLGGQHGLQNPSKTDPQWMKILSKIDSDVNQKIACILSGVLVALGANMVPKASQNGARGGVFWSCFSLWSGLGGLLRPLGAQEPILIDFC